MNQQIDPILRQRHLVLMALRSAADVLLVNVVYSFVYPIVRST